MSFIGWDEIRPGQHVQTGSPSGCLADNPPDKAALDKVCQEDLPVEDRQVYVQEALAS